MLLYFIKETVLWVAKFLLYFLKDVDEERIKPRAESLKNPQFLTCNGCAEYYPIWRTPVFIGGRLANLINGSIVDEDDPNFKKNVNNENDEEEKRASYKGN